VSIFIYQDGVLRVDETGVRNLQTHDACWFTHAKKLHIHQESIAIATLGSVVDWSEYEPFLLELTTTLATVEAVPSLGVKLNPPAGLDLSSSLIMTKQKVYISNKDSEEGSVGAVCFHAVIDDGLPIARSSEDDTVNTLISLGYSARQIMLYVTHFGSTITRYGALFKKQVTLKPLNAPVCVPQKPSTSVKTTVRKPRPKKAPVAVAG